MRLRPLAGPLAIVALAGTTPALSACSKTDPGSASPTPSRRVLSTRHVAGEKEEPHPDLQLPLGMPTTFHGSWTGGSVGNSFPGRDTPGQVDVAFRCSGVTDVVVTIGDGPTKMEVPTTCGSGFSATTTVGAHQPLPVRATGHAGKGAAYALGFKPYHR